MGNECQYAELLDYAKAFKFNTIKTTLAERLQFENAGELVQQMLTTFGNLKCHSEAPYHTAKTKKQ